VDGELPAVQLVQVARAGLTEIGYRDDLLRGEYRFADMLDEATPTRLIDLAAFAQDPPSYRSACFGVAVLDSYDANALQQYRALGAPQLLVLSPDRGEVLRWRVSANGPPTFIERIDAEHLRAAFRAHQNEWSPASILRAKAIGFARGPVQLDFFDSGLLPTLEGMTHDKLDRLLRDVIATSKAIYAEHHDSDPDYEGLFRLVFRFIASKMLANRGYPGEYWLDEDPQRVIAAVDAFYFQQAAGETVLQDRAVQEVAWGKIRNAFLFNNLSVEALAYVYENTLVSDRNRELLDTHATPPQIAEYVIQQLPLEELPQDARRVFEPFAGHAPFLIAALGRLRTLLPATLSASARHDYFVRMLSGMEIDAFAREVARYSLILADYPNPDGWDIAQADVFTSPRTSEYLQRAAIVLCNPPFSDRLVRGVKVDKRIGAAKRAVEALNRVMQHPPKQLGFVLPKVFVSGQEYRDARRRLADAYQNIDVVALPDTVFQHSDVETVLVIAHSGRSDSPRRRVIGVAKQDYQQFLQIGVPTWQEVLPTGLADATSSPVLWRTPLERVWDALKHLARLGDVAEVHRGIEYRFALRDQADNLVSSQPRVGFSPGLLNVREGFEPFNVFPSTFLNMDPAVMRRDAYKLLWDKPKVIANAARLSRGPWTIAAATDMQGIVCYQQFHGIWPATKVALTVVAAVINSPIANAFVSMHRTSRHNQVNIVKDIPFPTFTERQVETISSLVHQYQMYRALWREQPKRAEEIEAACRELLAKIDAQVLAAYDLPPRLEKQLLDTFTGYERPGPVQFTGYYPPGFQPAIPWRIFVSPAYQSSGAHATVQRLPVINDAVVSSAVRDLDDLNDDDRNADD
jgi:hypothetical protein